VRASTPAWHTSKRMPVSSGRGAARALGVPHCTVAVIDLLADGDARTRWAELAAAAQGAPPLPVPQGTDLAERLAELTVPYDAIAEIVAIATRLGEDHLEFIRVCAAAVLRAMGGREVVRFPAPAPPSDLGRFGFVLMYAGLVPVIRDFHAQIGAPDSVSRATLADLGRNMHVYRRRYGTSGFDKQEWLALHFTGRLYQLGRLQFERTAVDRRTASAVSAAGVQTAPGDPCCPYTSRATSARCGRPNVTSPSPGLNASSPRDSRPSRTSWRSASPGCWTHSWQRYWASSRTSRRSSDGSPWPSRRKWTTCHRWSSPSTSRTAHGPCYPGDPGCSRPFSTYSTAADTGTTGTGWFGWPQ